ncbi:unnamed protein product [Arctia plantaginis]|uniref:Telomere-associated protein RIF1 n=1 Tax=Arctia plantaginis TaxID=874455 RepID=A0A8S1B6V4_ARCPL|nr:unnamed protein product [Arctia plantaginis]
MPEEPITCTDVQSALENLEKYDPNYPVIRVRHYKTIQSALERDENLNREDLKRLLAVCVHDIPNMKYTATVINIIPAILSKVKEGSYDPPPDLVPSAAALINLLKTIALLGKVESLMALCLDTLSTYPEDTLMILTEQHYEDVIETLNVCCHTRIPTHIKLQVCNLLHKLLKILPREKKKEFVECGVSVWFSKIIPTVMAHMTVSGSETNIEILELLADDLVHVDYAYNSPWYNILECICNTKQYPATMKNLLHAGSDAWYRLWIVFIRLLKHQITQSLSSVGTPINSMLPVVEAAFKLDIGNRCKAFECWNVLIDSFSTETNESNINKRIKLLIIPLKSNNAKHEETSLAKFKCWWHLIRKFQNKMDKFLDMVLVSFLHFCFGRHNAVDKSVLVPGQLCANMKKHCNEALVDMVGHVNCDGCIELPKLKGKIINTKHLVDNWNHWIYSLTSVIMRTAKNDCGLTKQQMTCLWKSFLMTIGELPENNIRKDLFAEILSIVAHLVQECKSNNQFLEVTFNILILSLFDEDKKIKELLKSNNSPNDPIIRIIKIILDSSLHGFYNSLDPKELVTKFKLFTNLMLDEAVCTPKSIVDGLISDLPPNEYALMLWTALAESIHESKYDSCLLNTCDMMLWPLKSINVFTKVQIPAMTWYTTFDLIYPKLNKTEFEKISEILFSDVDVSKLPISTVYFKLCILLAILKHKFTENNCFSCEEEINLLLNLTKSINSYEFFESLMPMLVDRIVATLSTVTSNVNETVTALILVCVKNVLHVLTQACKQQSESKPVVAHIMLLVASLLKPLETLFTVESYSKLIPAMTYHLLRCSSLLSEHSSTRIITLSVMKTILTRIKSTDINYAKINNVISDIEKIKVQVMAINDLTSDTNTFPTPQTKEVPKRTKKKETNIVDTVVENGEEYVVVKSNWKFNPRKLTENQKEKLQRKREDIPALYQDLSQSQDEFKFMSWKSDPQDTNSSSKSESKSCKADDNEKALEILKNLPSTNVVPKILETILSENEKQSSNANELSLDNLRKVDISTPTNKCSKSPRMALKDRVFRNVRNLIEGSGVQKENKEATEEKSKTEVVNKTPTSVKSLISNCINSAPPLLAADRPARVKRKPKKFEDLELLISKKSRMSLPDVQSSQTHQSDNSVNSVKSNQNENVIHTSDNNEINSSNDMPECNDKVADIEIGFNEQNTTEIGFKDSEKVKENINASKSREIDANVSAAVTDEDVMDISLQNTLDDVGEISISKLSKDGNQIIAKDDSVGEISIPKFSKDGHQMIATDDKEISTYNITVAETRVATPTTLKAIDKDLSTHFNSNLLTYVDVANATDVKEVSNSATSKVLTPKVIKTGKTVINSDITNEIKEVSSTISKDAVITQGIGTPKISKDDKKVSDNDIKDKSPKEIKNAEKELRAPQQPKDFKQISTPKSTKEIKEKPTTDVFKEVKVLLTPQQSKEIKEMSTPKQSPKNDEQKSAAKKSTVKKSRIEKELAIDTVEGHPFLKIQSDKRLTRKALESANSGRRKSLVDKLNKSKSGGSVSSLKSEKKTKGKETENTSSSSCSTVVVDESQERDSEQSGQTSSTDELPSSDDFIESSQDSTITTISVKSTRKTPKKYSDVNKSLGNHESKDDTVLPVNKTALEDKSREDLTENMDTESLEQRDVSDDVILINNRRPVLTVAIEDTIISTESQEVAEADTQPTDPKEIMDIDDNLPCKKSLVNVANNHIPETYSEGNDSQGTDKDQFIVEEAVDTQHNTADNTTITLSDSAFIDKEQASGASSPFKDEIQRQQDFLNSTIEISPIKTMSPDRNKKSPSPETSSDYVVIKLTSPVHCNGEPFEKGSSPEVFTEDKASLDKRDQSPPREEISVTNTSPSSSLSLKKNRPQVRSGGRAAQMLGLCVPEKVQAIVNPERNESEEVKKSSTNTPARRNLRILYNSVGENTESSSSNGTSDNDDSEHFLKFKRSLPGVDCSPSGPILKRKLVEITDDATVSPASKRKRVSFHDPPVSTTISVQKYIEPGAIRSPQNSAHKRLERQLRQHIPQRSPKRLDNVFKLDTVLTKTVQSFIENEVITIPDDSQAFSLDETPVVEVVRTSELNNTDPICPALMGCKDPIENVASELSSPTMKSLLIKELEGTIETIGDLAKLTELEVNRLCIKAPKVTVAKKVLTDYASKLNKILTIEEAEFAQSMNELHMKSSNIEVQTDKFESSDTEMQTDEIPMRAFSAQTEAVSIAHTSVQTCESGSKTTADIVKSCLSEKSDFVAQLGENLEESAIKELSQKLLLSTVTDLLMKKITPSDTRVVLDRLLEYESSLSNDNSKRLSFIRDYLCDKFDTKDLLLLCSQILKIVYDKPA